MKYDVIKSTDQLMGIWGLGNIKQGEEMKMTVSTAPSAGYADCPECGDKAVDKGYSCERCDVQVTICNNCHTILEECGCGLCKKGLTFYESA